METESFVHSPIVAGIHSLKKALTHQPIYKLLNCPIDYSNKINKGPLGNAVLATLFKYGRNMCKRKSVIQIRVIMFKQQKLLFKKHNQTPPKATKLHKLISAAIGSDGWGSVSPIAQISSEQAN